MNFVAGTSSGTGTGLAQWLQTPAGACLLESEQRMIDPAVADLFGYYALQLGLPAVPLLRTSRVPSRLVCDAGKGADVSSDFDALPFATASIDVIVMPHVLEFSENPHHVLREVERVLRPEGHLLVLAFNPISLWGLRRMIPYRRDSYPWCGQYLSPLRLKDWLNLLGFDVQAVGFCGYAPAVRSESWLRRWQFLDRFGARWWPVCGAVCLMHGVKRVQGMRLIAPRWGRIHTRARAIAPVTNRLPKSGSARES